MMGIGKDHFVMGQAAANVLFVCEESFAENHGGALISFHHY